MTQDIRPLSDERLAEIEDRTQDAAARGHPCDEMDAHEIISLVMEARAARKAKESRLEEFVEWLRPWVKSHFGKWITHNTAKGAFNDYQAAIGKGKP